MTGQVNSHRRTNKFGIRLDSLGRAARTVDGRVFASQAEARRYGQLRILERAGQIHGLECQPRYPLVVDGHHVGTYVADFRYQTAEGAIRVEDVKGAKTREYVIKSKLLKALYGIEITEISA